MSNTIISDKYQVVIPKAVREKANLKRGQILHVYSVDDGSVLLTPQKKWPDDYICMDKDVWKNIDVVEYLRNERASWDRDSLKS